MVIESFASKVVFLDTAPLIYFMESRSIYQPVLSRLFDFNDKDWFSFVTSTIAFLEVLVRPLREGQMEVSKQYREILTTVPGIELFDVTSSIAEQAARLRARYNLRIPDAVRLATSIEIGTDYFLTNDNRLKVVNETTIVGVDELQ